MKDISWDSTTRRIVAVGLVIFGLYIIYLIRSVIPYLAIGGVIAFLLAPVISFQQERLRLPKWLAMIFAYILMVLVLITIILFIIPGMVNAFSDIDVDFLNLTDVTLRWTIDTLRLYRSIQFYGQVVELSSVIDPALEFLTDLRPERLLPSLDSILALIPRTVQVTWDVTTNVVGVVSASFFAIFLTFLYSIYLSASGGYFIKSIIMNVPKPYRPEFTELYRRIHHTWGGYFRGQLILGLVIGVMVWASAAVIGLPGAFALGVIAGLLEFIPNLGPFLAAVPAVIIALVQGSDFLPVDNLVFALIVIGVYWLIQQLENNLIVPKVLGEAVELHPLIVMIGVVAGAANFGILGALLAAPVIASFRIVLAYLYAKVQGQHPFPARLPRQRPKSNTSWQAQLTAWRGKLPF